MLNPLNNSEKVPVPLKSLPNSHDIRAEKAVPIIPVTGAKITHNNTKTQGEKSDKNSEFPESCSVVIIEPI